jgi:hypothetical protein
VAGCDVGDYSWVDSSNFPVNLALYWNMLPGITPKSIRDLSQGEAFVLQNLVLNTTNYEGIYE